MSVLQCLRFMYGYFIKIYRYDATSSSTYVFEVTEFQLWILIGKAYLWSQDIHTFRQNNFPYSAQFRK